MPDSILGRKLRCPSCHHAFRAAATLDSVEDVPDAPPKPGHAPRPVSPPVESPAPIAPAPTVSVAPPAPVAPPKQVIQPQPPAPKSVASANPSPSRPPIAPPVAPPAAPPSQPPIAQAPAPMPLELDLDLDLPPPTAKSAPASPPSSSPARTKSPGSRSESPEPTHETAPVKSKGIDWNALPKPGQTDAKSAKSTGNSTQVEADPFTDDDLELDDTPSANRRNPSAKRTASRATSQSRAGTASDDDADDFDADKLTKRRSNRKLGMALTLMIGIMFAVIIGGGLFLGSLIPRSGGQTAVPYAGNSSPRPVPTTAVEAREPMPAGQPGIQPGIPPAQPRFPANQPVTPQPVTPQPVTPQPVPMPVMPPVGIPNPFAANGQPGNAPQADAGEPDASIAPWAGVLQGDGELSKLVPARTVKANGNAEQLLISKKHNRLIARNSGSAISVIDLASGKLMGIQRAQHRFLDMGLSPDESVLFASDYSGENTGDGNPLGKDQIHRLDVAAGTWTVGAAPKVAARLEVVDNDRFLLLEQDQWVDVSLNRWDRGTVTEIHRVSCGYSGDIQYDPTTRRLYHGNRGSSSSEVMVLQLNRNRLTNTRTGSGTIQIVGYDSGIVLSSDASRVYYGRSQLEALDVKRTIRWFPDAILGGTRDIALGEMGYYHAHTGNKLGAWPNPVKVLAVSGDGLSVWIFDSAASVFREYRVELAK
ncbi:hypothetical protein [Tuwongella immobilis]|nr:hypothetical protein [Tuwongella immobilis]